MPAQPRAAQRRQTEAAPAVGQTAERRQRREAAGHQNAVQRRIRYKQRPEGKEQVIPKQQLRPQPGRGGQVFEQPQRAGFRDQGVKPPAQRRGRRAGPVGQRARTRAAKRRKHRQRHQSPQQPAERRGQEKFAHRHPARRAVKSRQRLHAARKIPKPEQKPAAHRLRGLAERPEQQKQAGGQHELGQVGSPQPAAGGPHNRRAAVRPILRKDRHREQKGKEQQQSVGDGIAERDLGPVGRGVGDGQAVQRRILRGGALRDADIQPAAAGKDALAELVGPLGDLLQVIRVSERPLGLGKPFLQDDPLLRDARAKPQCAGFAQGGQVVRRVAAVGQHPQRRIPHRLVRGLLEHQQRDRDIQRILPGREVGCGLGRRGVGAGGKDGLFLYEADAVCVRGQRPAERVERGRQQQQRAEQQEGRILAQLARLGPQYRPHSAAPLFSLS